MASRHVNRSRHPRLHRAMSTDPYGSIRYGPILDSQPRGIGVGVNDPLLGTRIVTEENRPADFFVKLQTFLHIRL